MHFKSYLVINCLTTYYYYTFQTPHNTLNVPNQNKTSLTVNWLSRFASLHIMGSGLSGMLSDVVIHGHMSLHLRQAKTPEGGKKTITRALQHVR